MKSALMRLGLAAIFGSAFFAAPSRALAVTLVEKGKVRAVIIVPEKPGPVVENAARVLRDHIKEMSRAELPIRAEDRITEAPSADQAWVLVGAGKDRKSTRLNSSHVSESR